MTSGNKTQIVCRSPIDHPWVRKMLSMKPGTEQTLKNYYKILLSTNKIFKTQISFFKNRCTHIILTLVEFFGRKGVALASLGPGAQKS